MSNSQVFLNGEILNPIFAKSQALGRSFVQGKDDYGPYIACRLNNRNPSALYGWYIFVSPEELQLMKDHNWCGNIVEETGIQVRRRETVDGVPNSVPLTQEIWRRAYGEEPLDRIHKRRHPLDYRRNNLTLWVFRDNCRGITELKGGGYQVQITLDNESVYIGKVTDEDEGYRMYNRYLRELKNNRPLDTKIQVTPYNKVEPLF